MDGFLQHQQYQNTNNQAHSTHIASGSRLFASQISSKKKTRCGWLRVVIYGKIMVARNYDKKGMEMVEKGNGNG